MPYFVITSDEDGTHVEEMSAEALLKAITPNEYGDTDYGEVPAFLKKIPKSDKGCWYGDDVPENAMLVIKGEIVVPRVVETVMKLTLE